MIWSYYLCGLLCILLVALFVPAGHWLHRELTTHGKTSGAVRFPRCQVPKTAFRYFYAIGLLSAIVTLKLEAPCERLFVLHLLRRLLETIWWPYSDSSQMHLIHAIVGLSYYPILVLAMAASSQHYRTLQPGDYLLLAALSALQSYVHYTLWRQRRPQRHGKSVHVPVADRHPWLFGLTLSPHYFAEIGIYGLFSSLTAWSFLMCWNLAFVALNLLVSARHTAIWYRDRFPKAICKPII